LELVQAGGIGHSLAIHSNNEDIIREFALKKPIFRVLVNTSSSLGGVGATTGLFPSFTLGSGTWGGSSVSENVNPRHLLNTKRVAWPIRVPEMPQIKTPAPTECRAGDEIVDSKMVDEIVNRLMKAIHENQTLVQGS